MLILLFTFITKSLLDFITYLINFLFANLDLTICFKAEH